MSEGKRCGNCRATMVHTDPQACWRYWRQEAGRARQQANDLARRLNRGSNVWRVDVGAAFKAPDEVFCTTDAEQAKALVAAARAAGKRAVVRSGKVAWRRQRGGFLSDPAHVR